MVSDVDLNSKILWLVLSLNLADYGSYFDESNSNILWLVLSLNLADDGSNFDDSNSFIL